MQQVINIGAVPNDGTGDPLRVAFNKCNDNFNELYASGAVSSVGVVVANGITGSVANPTTTPVISLGLGAITPSSINGVILSGSSTPSLAVTGATSVSGTNTGDITLAGTPDYITIAGQTITRNQIDLATDVTSTLPVANGGTGITSFGSGVATFLGTPSSANLAAAVTDETGTGSLVFSNSPTLTTPDLGTPSAGTLTNCTIPYSNVNNIVSNRILARSTAGIGGAEILTASNVLDFITSTQGAITYRASGQWFGLAPSTAGYVLTTNGAGADPSWSQVSLTGGVTGTLPVANGGTGVTTSTGTGSTVLNNAPTFTGQVTVATGTAAAPAITPTGDSNTGVYFPAADTVGLVTGGVERLRIFSNQQVVAGNTAGSVSGTIPDGAGASVTPQLQNVLSSGVSAISAGVADGVRGRRVGIFVDDTNGVAGISTTYSSGGGIPFVFRDAGGERFRIDSTGRVGIGKTPSLGLLDVNGDAYFNTVRVGLGNGNVSTNTALGTNTIAGASVTGARNTAVGSAALNGLSGGNDNVAVGRAALTSISSASNNTAIGSAALSANTASDNTAVGYQALTSNTSGSSNTSVGRTSSRLTSTGNYNTAVGTSALEYNTTSSSNTAVGYYALNANTAADNTAVGMNALTANTSGTSNTAVGRSAGAAITTGSNNAAFGNSALFTCSTASANAAFGREALKLNTASDNTAFGCEALTNNSSGTNNVAVGRSALAANTTTSQSTAVGRSALALSTASDNTALGWQAGNVLTTGASNTIIGSDADASAATGTGQIVIGKGVTGTANNRITVGITTNIAELDLDGADTSWAASSDERLKKNVADYAAGLDVITALRPVTYQWRSRKEVPTELTNYYADSDEPVHGDASKTYHGFLAQEVKAVLDATPSVPNGQHLWEQRDDGVQTLAPADLVPILVNAIKQLTARVQALENA